MIYTAIDPFYLTDEQLQNSPSRKDGIDEATETTLRIYGCDLIQESGILLKLPQAVMASGQDNVYMLSDVGSDLIYLQRVAASCVWLASKLEESPRKQGRYSLFSTEWNTRSVTEPDASSSQSKLLSLELSFACLQKYAELKMDLNRTERHLLKEMGFICHVKHPHKFISNYLAALETPPELRQEAWNLANDSTCLRTTLCVRFKSEVVACGVVYAAARRFQVPLPENPPWWKAFDADKSGIDEEGSLSVPPANNDTSTPKAAPATANLESGGSKGALIKEALDKLKESKKSGNDSESVPVEAEAKEEPVSKLKSERWDRDRGRDSDREREREDIEREREKVKDRGHRSKDKGKDSG
ncbi:Cyclin-L1-1 [Camellia lanceoleosa]|nr:Cyclin-L1-1 [Camellia lanceoleosa]